LQKVVFLGGVFVRKPRRGKTPPPFLFFLGGGFGVQCGEGIPPENDGPLRAVLGSRKKKSSRGEEHATPSDYGWVLAHTWPPREKTGRKKEEIGSGSGVSLSSGEKREVSRLREKEDLKG